jgi:hypothetical protein
MHLLVAAPQSHIAPGHPGRPDDGDQQQDHAEEIRDLGPKVAGLRC